MKPEYKFNAFISYSHVDRKWANWLHHKLENYRVPRQLVGQVNRDGVIPRKLRIYRDQTDLSASPDLNASIHAALDRSLYLIVICSPSSAASPYVESEIVYFKSLGREDHILCLIVDGEPNTHRTAGVDPKRECFPRALRFQIDSEGIISDRMGKDFIAGDVRKQADGPRDAYLKVLAGLLDVRFFDDFKQRELRRSALRMKIIAGFLLLLVVVLGGLSYTTYRAKENVTETLGKSDFIIGSRLLGEDQANEALAYLARAVRVGRSRVATALLDSTLLQRSWNLPAGAAMTHARHIRLARFSPEGDSLLTVGDGDSSESIHLWDQKTGRKILSFRPEASWTDAIFDGHGGKVIALSKNGEVWTWDAKSGDPSGQALQVGSAISSSCFSPDGRLLAVAYLDCTAKIWNLSTRQSVTLQLPSQALPITGVRFSADGQKLAAISEPISSNAGMSTMASSLSTDETSAKRAGIRVWEAATGQPLTNLLPYSEKATKFEFSPDGRLLSAATRDFKLVLWELPSGKSLGNPEELKYPVTSLSFSPDSRYVLASAGAGAWGGAIMLWDTYAAQGGPKRAELKQEILDAKFSPDGRWFTVASRNGTARVWSVQDLRPLIEPIRHEGWVDSAQFSPDGRQILTVSGNQARLWNIQLLPPYRLEAPQSDYANAAVLSPDDRTIAVGYSAAGSVLDAQAAWGGYVQLWDTEHTNMPIRKPLKHRSPIQALEFNPADGNMLATACGMPAEVVTHSGYAQIWNVTTGQAVSNELAHPSCVREVHFSRDGQWLLTACYDWNTTDCRARVWNVKTGALQTDALRHQGTINSARFSPDGLKVVTASDDKTARIWQTGTGRALTPPLQHDLFVMSADFSPDGKRIVTAGGFSSAKGFVQVWDAVQGTPLGKTIRLDARVDSVCFSPDGHLILGRCRDRFVRLWDAATGQLVIEPIAHPSRVNVAEFSPDGLFILTACGDVLPQEGQAQVWNVLDGRPISNPIRHDKAVYSAAFNRGGIMTLDPNVLRITEYFGPLGLPPTWLPDLAEAIGGLRLSYRDVIAPVVHRDQRLEQLRLRINSDADSAWKKFGLWLLADPWTRTLSPNSSEPVSEREAQLVADDTAKSLNQALDLDPGNALALASLWQKDARRLLETEYGNGSVADVDSFYQRFSNSTRAKAHADVLTALACRRAPQMAMVWNKRAVCLNLANRPAEALDAVDAGLRTNSRLSVLHNTRANILIHLNRKTEALEAFNKAIQTEQTQLTPDQSVLRAIEVNRENLKTELGQVSSTSDSFKMNLAALDKQAQSVSDRVQCMQLADGFSQLEEKCLQAGQFKEGQEASQLNVQVLERLLANKPELDPMGTALAMGYQNLAYFDLLLHQAPQAIEASLKALHASPDFLTAYTNLAHGYLFSGQYEKAWAIYLKYKDQHIEPQKSFAQAVLEDLAFFRSQGLTHPDVERVEKSLKPSVK